MMASIKPIDKCPRCSCRIESTIDPENCRYHLNCGCGYTSHGFLFGGRFGVSYWWISFWLTAATFFIWCVLS